MMGNTPTASQIPEPVNITAFAVPSKANSSKQLNSQGLQMSHNIQLRLSVVRDLNANHVLIRVRHRSRTSPWVSFSEISSPNPSRPRTSPRRPHPHLCTSLPLAPSDQFRTETTIVDSTHSFAFFDETLNSSMMFSSMFMVVRSCEPHCPQCLAWAALTTISSPSQPRLQFLLLTSCSRTPSTLQCTHPVSCLVTRHLFGLCT